MKFLKKQIHVSWLISVWCGLFVIGVCLAQYIDAAFVWIITVSILCSVAAFFRKRVYMLPILSIGALGFGLWDGSVVRGDLKVYTPLIGQQVELSGKVKEDPTINAKRMFVVQLDSITIKGHQLPGSVWVSMLGHPDVLRSDTITVHGILGEGFGTYSGVMYTAKLVSYSRPVPGDIGRVVRDWFASAIRRAVPEPQASLGIGYLTGQKSALPADLSQALQIAGLSHVVVASGYNLTILVRLARRLFMGISKFVSAFLSTLLIISFMSVTGLSPSMTRAGLVSGLSLLTWYYGRRAHPFVLLPFAAAITVAFQPSYTWGDLGWQLSFSAFAAVILVGPLLQRFFFGDKEPGTLRQILGETVAAHIVTLPIIIVGFGVISNVAIIANILIVPLVPLAMLLTFISGIVALMLPHLAGIIALPATWLLTYMTTTAQYVAELPWSQMKIGMPWWGVGVYYLVLVSVCVLMWRITKLDLRSVNSIL